MQKATALCHSPELFARSKMDVSAYVRDLLASLTWAEFGDGIRYAGYAIGFAALPSVVLRVLDYFPPSGNGASEKEAKIKIGTDDLINWAMARDIELLKMKLEILQSVPRDDLLFKQLSEIDAANTAFLFAQFEKQKQQIEMNFT